jgi:phosphate transport system substrate-binding protein
MKMKRTILVAAAVILAVFAYAGAGGKNIVMEGSTTVLPIAQAAAEAFMGQNPGVEISVRGGGSGVGIAALIKGAVDIANASRNMKPEEIQAATRNNPGRAPKETVVGHDALAIYVHKDNPLSEITLEQLAQIYVEGGTTARWSQLGVKIPGASDDTIVRVSRQSSSGTYEFFRQHVLGEKDFGMGSLDLNGSKEVVQLVGSTRTAIGYSGMGYATPAVKVLGVSTKKGERAFLPTAENTINKSYPMARSLLVYTLGEPQGEVKKYVDWILSDAGQRILAESGYVPLTPAEHPKH